MKTRILKYFTLLLIPAFFLLSCGGGGEKKAETKTADKSVVQKSPQKKELTPDEIGQKIGAIYVQSMSDVTELLKDKPEFSEIRGEVETLREQCIRELVELGKLREALDAAGRAGVDRQVSLKVNSLYNDPLFTTYNEIQQHYFKDQEFHKIVMSFNIITQYADFELLKKQEPEEAARLGIQ